LNRVVQRTRRLGDVSSANRLAGLWLPLVGVSAFVVVWQLTASVVASIADNSTDSRLPKPWRIAQAFMENEALFLDALWVTCKGALLGLAVGIVIGVVVAWLSVASRIMESVIYPYLVASQMVPTIILAPIILAVIQDGDTARVVSAAYISFFVIALNLTKGLRSISPDQLTLLRSLRAHSWQYYTKLRWPGSLPYFFVGLKVAAPLSVVGEVTIELTGAQNGLGTLTLTSLKYGEERIYTFWAAVFLIGLLGYAMFLVASVLERALTPWQPEFRRETR
jgi:NitT/TauT family transport system permease protein